MEKEFVPYKPSLRLKAIGFDEPCFGYYGKGVLSIEIIKSGKIFTNEDSIYFDKDSSCLAPTFSQAFRWFREKHGLVIQYIPSELDNSEHQSILHHKYRISEYDSWRGGRRNTVETELNEDYEEAELACLNKLIEIVETKEK